MAKLLMTVPGIGHYSALLIVSEVGDINRFPDSYHLCSYVGPHSFIKLIRTCKRIGLFNAHILTGQDLDHMSNEALVNQADKTDFCRLFQLLPAAGHEQVLSFQLSLKNINGVTGANIHNGKQGENGPVVADLFNPSGPTGAINGKLAAGTLTSSKLTGSLQNKELSALVNMIRSGEAYVNIHTTQNQNGEVRGQIS